MNVRAPRKAPVARLPVLVLAVGLMGTPPAARADEPEAAYLVSIGSIPLGPNQYVDRFHLDTRGVDFLALCQIPWGWRLTVGRSSAPDGVLDGAGSLGVTYMNQSTPTKLTDLVLVRISTHPPPTSGNDRSQPPAAFTGYASVGLYGSDAADAKVALDRRNIRLRRASRCPPPNR